MKKFLLLLLTSSLLYTITPQSLNGRFSSSVYSFERIDTGGTSNVQARTYQMLSVNFGKDNVWLRSNLNLEADIANSLKNDPRLRFYNLYVDVQNIWNLVSLKLGRQPLYNNVAGGVFDGGTLSLGHSGYKLQLYYGGNVPAYQKFEITDDWSDNYVLGGEFSIYALTDWRFAAKYVNKNFKNPAYTATRLDSLLNPIEYTIESRSLQYEYLTGEISYYKQNIVNLNARYDFDVNFQTTSRLELSGRYEEVKNLGLSLYYNYREPKVRYNSIFSVFDYANTWEIEAGADYLILDKYTVFGKVANVAFKNETSQRATLGLSTKWGSITGRKNFGYAGEMDAVSLYTAFDSFEGMLTPSCGLSYTRYKLSKNDPYNELITLLAGANFRPFRTLSFDLQGQYLNNKIYKNDWRLFFKLNFWFNTIF